MNWITYFLTAIYCRPISLLTSFSKTFEILIHQRLVQHVSIHNINSPKQFGLVWFYFTFHKSMIGNITFGYRTSHNTACNNHNIWQLYKMYTNCWVSISIKILHKGEQIVQFNVSCYWIQLHVATAWWGWKHVKVHANININKTTYVHHLERGQVEVNRVRYNTYLVLR